MSNQPRCNCTRCTIRALMGPAIITTLGILFLLNELLGGRFSFGNTYPFVMIVIGGMLLASAIAPMEGHVEAMPPVPPVAPPSAPPTHSNPYSGQGR